MNMENKKDALEFESKYHYKLVKLRGIYFKNLPQKEYVVTSALLNYEDNGETTIFAIKALDYNLENKHWITIKINKKDFDMAMSDFEIIGDYPIKGEISDEVIVSYKSYDDENWLVQTSSYLFPERFGKELVPKKNFKRDIVEGDEYLFIYKSIFDLGEPSNYIIRIPEFEYREQVEEYVKPFRQDILDGNVAFGMNKRLIYNNEKL